MKSLGIIHMEINATFTKENKIMNKVSTYDYSELDIHQESKLYFACLVDEVEGFTIQLDADKQESTIIFK